MDEEEKEDWQPPPREEGIGEGRLAATSEGRGKRRGKTGSHLRGKREEEREDWQPPPREEACGFRRGKTGSHLRGKREEEREDWQPLTCGFRRKFSVSCSSFCCTRH